MAHSILTHVLVFVLGGSFGFLIGTALIQRKAGDKPPLR